MPLRLLSLTLFFLLNACGGGLGDIIGGNIYSAAKPTSPYAAVLSVCSQAKNLSQACSLNTLPFIGQEHDNPSISHIMDRTAISHPWMATRFEEALNAMPSDILRLFKGVTAIVIAYDIRPSYYSPNTGAIYLDPADLWLTNEEKSSIAQNPDYRADFGNDLNFASLGRYVQGNQYAWSYYDLSGTETRTLNDIIAPLARLLFHELAHANDFLPPALIGTLRSDLSVSAALNAIQSQSISMTLDASSPLNSSMLKRLADVQFRGVAADTNQQLLSPLTVGTEFETDGASDDYAYSTIYEDTAMLFEEAMMKHHFNIDREIAYTDAASSNSCADYIVRWGFRHRIGEPLVKSRAEHVLQGLLDMVDVSSYTASLTAPVAMSAGLDWCTNLAQFTPLNKSINSSQKLSKSTNLSPTIRPADLLKAH